MKNEQVGVVGGMRADAKMFCDTMLRDGKHV